MDSEFNDLEKSSWGGLLGMYGRLFRLIDADLQSHFGISHVEFEVLLRLSWRQDRRARIQDLATQSVLTRSGVSRLVERLEGLGLVRREKADEDRRGAYAILTDKGEALFREAVRTHVAFVRQHFLRHFDESELQQMSEFWRRIEDEMKKTDS